MFSCCRGGAVRHLYSPLDILFGGRLIISPTMLRVYLFVYLVVARQRPYMDGMFFVVGEVSYASHKVGANIMSRVTWYTSVERT